MSGVFSRLVSLSLLLCEALPGVEYCAVTILSRSLLICFSPLELEHLFLKQ